MNPQAHNKRPVAAYHDGLRRRRCRLLYAVGFALFAVAVGGCLAMATLGLLAPARPRASPRSSAQRMPSNPEDAPEDAAILFGGDAAAAGTPVRNEAGRKKGRKGLVDVMYRHESGARQDIVATLVKRDGGLPRLMQLAEHEASAASVVLTLTFASLLQESPREMDACSGPQSFSFVRIGSLTALEHAPDHVVGVSSTPLVEPIVAEARAKRYDGAPAAGMVFFTPVVAETAGGGSSKQTHRRLVFGKSSSGATVPLQIDLTDGRVLVVGSANGRGLVVARATSRTMVCLAALSQRRVESRRVAQLRGLLAPLTLASATVVEDAAMLDPAHAP